MLDWELVRMATMVTHTSRTLVMSAVPKVTRTRYCAADAMRASAGCARSLQVQRGNSQDVMVEIATAVRLLP